MRPTQLKMIVYVWFCETYKRVSGKRSGRHQKQQTIINYENFTDSFYSDNLFNNIC
jgi:hypothetical protein